MLYFEYLTYTCTHTSHVDLNSRFGRLEFKGHRSQRWEKVLAFRGTQPQASWMNRAGLGPLCYVWSGCMGLSTWLWGQREDEKCGFTHGSSRASKFQSNEVCL